MGNGIFEQIMDMSRLTYMMQELEILKEVDPKNKLVKKLERKIKQLSDTTKKK